MRLPNAERAFVDVRKLRDYCLNPDHFKGRHKARVFAATLGLTADHAHVLRDSLLRAALEEDAIPGEGDEFGQRFIVDFVMESATGHSRVRSAWIVRTGEDFPRLTSCYVL